MDMLFTAPPTDKELNSRRGRGIDIGFNYSSDSLSRMDILNMPLDVQKAILRSRELQEIERERLKNPFLAGAIVRERLSKNEPNVTKRTYVDVLGDRVDS